MSKPSDLDLPPRHDLVELSAVDPSIRLDVVYATEDNFLGARVYEEARVFVQRPVAEDLLLVQAALAEEGLGLLVFDGYRPWSVTKRFWDETPEEQRRYVANPEWGSRHNRGAAVDLTLVQLASGEPLPMPSAFDEFTERAHADYAGASEEETRHREQLRRIMEAHRFSVYEWEWWHFDHESFEEWPLLDVRFSEIVADDQL